MADLEQSLEELESVKQAFKSNIGANGISTSSIEFRNYPNLINQMEKKLPTQTKTITPTKEKQTVSADSGYKLGSVEVDEIPDEYIIPIGTKEITENGTHSVSEYENVEVNVPSTEPNLIQKEITENGTYTASDDNADGYSSVIVNVAGSGGGGSGGVEDVGDGKYICRVIDYDGTVIKEKHLNSGEVFTLPETPIRDRLTFQEWSSPFDFVDNQITVTDCDIIVCAIYKTTSGKNEFDIELNKSTGLTVSFIGTYGGTKDWGDGTVDTSTKHTYSEYGKYTILASRSIIEGGSTANMFSISSAGSRNLSCVAIRLAGDVSAITQGAFCFMGALRYVTIPNSVTKITGDVFKSSPTLRFVGLPNSVVQLGGGSFVGYTRMFDYAYLMKNIIIPKNLTQLEQYNFYNTTALESVFIPKNISTIASANFNYLYNCRGVYFTQHTSVPTLSSTSVFSDKALPKKIIVPDNLYDEWITATNWSTYADFIYKASEV